MKRSLILFFFCGLTLSSLAEEKIWPINIPISPSSSFAEQRGMRHHAGLDLRTQHKNGFPVVAIEDGYVSRVAVSFRSYGKALYIDHPKLKARVVYAHLQDFTGDVKKYIDEKLKKLGKRYGVNDFFKPEKFPVKKGQIVAYTGETGAGPSHLHFEMRTFNDEPVSPAVFGYRAPDKVYPVYKNFYIEPMEFGTVIENSFLPFASKIKKISQKKYSVEKTPVVSGKIGFKCGVSDTNEGNVFGVEKISLVVNGKPLIERVMHKYSYAEDRQATWVYDYFKTAIRNTGFVYNLYKLPMETLDFAKNYAAWSGLVNTADYPLGKLNYAVNSQDYGLNSITAEGSITCGKIDFGKEIPNTALKDYSAFSATQNTFSLIASAKRLLTPNDVVQPVFGYIVCKDVQGKSANIPCIIRKDAIELSFPNEARWQGGAFAGDKTVLQKTSYIDEKGGIVVSDGAEIRFPNNSLNFGGYVSLTVANNKPSKKFGKKGALTPKSPVWSLKPDNVVFDKEATLKIKYDGNASDTQKLGIYSVGSDGSYSHNGEAVEKGELKCVLRAGGQFVVLEDSVPPELQYAGKSSTYDLGSCYTFTAFDMGEGIDYLSGVGEVDGKAVEVMSDPDHRAFYVKRSGTATATVKLTIKDNAGNSAIISVKK